MQSLVSISDSDFQESIFVFTTAPLFSQAISIYKIAFYSFGAVMLDF
jgi:hypothetical protein